MAIKPWFRTFLWVSALLLGGAGLIVLGYSLIASVPVSFGATAIVLALLAVAYMILVLLSFERSKSTGNTRLSDRERRGF